MAIRDKGALRTSGVLQSFKELLFPQRVKVFLLAKLGDTLKIVESGKAKSTLTTFKKNDREYLIKLEKAILDTDNTPILFYDMENTNPLTFYKESLKHSRDKKEIIMNPRDVRTLLSTKKLRDKLSTQEQIIYWIIIVGLLIGVVGIAFYSFQVQSGLLQEIAKLKGVLT